MSCNLVVYSYRPAHGNQRKFAVATGDRPQDVVSKHGSQSMALRAAKKLAKKLGCSVKVDH
jgi:hypothetical protein